MSHETNQAPQGGAPHPDHYVREWRVFMGWSQEKLADMVDVHQSKIARIETGERKLKTSFLKEIARVIGVPSSAVLEVNPATESGAQTASMLLAWNQLTASQRSDVLRMVRALASPNDKPNAG